MKLTVVGSINLDFSARAPALPRPGETVTGAALSRHPGGKGANQALAAQRLGAEVSLVGRVGGDAMAGEALTLLRAGGVDLTGVGVDSEHPTGVALIAVDPTGENQIVVAPGANHAMTTAHLPERIDAPLIVQLELPVAVVEAAVALATGFICANLAPALPISGDLLERLDLIVVNRTEADFYGDTLHKLPGLVVITRGPDGAALYQQNREVVAVASPRIEAFDATGAGDAFVAALTVALFEGRDYEQALVLACATGALTAMQPGAQPSLPMRAEVEAFLERGI